LEQPADASARLCESNLAHSSHAEEEKEEERNNRQNELKQT
jgi:hypothetical protein